MSSEHPDLAVFNSAREELRNQIEWRKIQKKLVAGSEPYGSAPVRELMEATQFCCYNKQHPTGINLDALLADIIRRFADKSSLRINRSSVQSVVVKKRSELLAKCNPKLLTSQISPRYLGKKIYSNEIIWVTVVEWLKDSLESEKPIDEFIKELHKMFLDILDALMAAEVITLDDDDTPTGTGQSSSQSSSGQRPLNSQPNQRDVITLSDDDDEPIGARQQQDRPAAPLNPSRQPPVPKPSSQSQSGRGNGQAPNEVEVISLSDDDDEEGQHTAPISTGSSESSRQQIQQQSVEQSAPVPGKRPGSSLEDHTNRNAAPSDVPSDQSTGRRSPKIARTSERQEVTRPHTTKSIGIQVEEAQLQPLAPIPEVNPPVDRPVQPASSQNIQQAPDQARAVDIQAVQAPVAPAPIGDVVPPADPAAPARRGRGRPRKNPVPAGAPSPIAAQSTSSAAPATRPQPSAPVASSTRRSGSSRSAAPATTRSTRSSVQLTNQQKAEIRELVANDRSLQVTGKRAATKIAEQLQLNDGEMMSQKIQLVLNDLAKERKESAQRERMPRKAKKN